MCWDYTTEYLCVPLTTNGLVERLNGTLKRILHHSMQKDPCKWDLLLQLLLFAIRDTPHDSPKYLPFKLVLGHTPQNLLQVMREEWELLNKNVRTAEVYQ